jgi:uncharacterized repeat protein (TIGR01451 family)
MSKARRTLSAGIALCTALVWLPMMAGAAVASDPILVPDPTINGVLPTPGSENTHKRLDPTFPSDFNPGGVVGYVVDFPVDAGDVGGDFAMTDCVYVDPPGAAADAPIAKYFVHFVPNAEDFHLQFSVPIPANTPLGSQFCNYVKTTQSPSASQASNRKAGPACFTVGGGLRIEKRSGSTEGPLLGGASFSVVCSPTTASPPTIITGLSNPSQINANTTVSASGSAADGTIAINGPSGTPCIVTETAAPAGYQVDPTPRNLVIPVGASQTVNVFVNEQLGSLSVSKHAVGGGGTFHFTVSCDDGETYAPFDMTVAAGDTDTHLVSDQIVVGTECTVSESANALFSTTRSPSNGTVTIDADGETVAYTNTRLTGSLVVMKASDVDATFSFDVDCDGTAFDTTLQITTSGGSGSASVSNIPTGTSCTVTEQSNPLFSSVVTPGDGTVTIAVGDNTVSFTNTRLRGTLVITKSADVDGTFTFDVDCSDDAYDASNVQITTSGGAGSASVNGIPTGVTCTVTEDADPHWTTQVVPADGTVTINTGDNTVAFTNTRVRGDLVIDKTADIDGTFHFDVDCTDDAYDQTDLTITTSGGTGSASVEGIPTGVECTVTEHADAHWTVEVVPADGTVTIAAGDNTVAFDNTRVRGSLEINKTSDEDATFTFDVDCDGTDYDVQNVTITTVGGTGHATIPDIPTGTSCTVTEDANPLFTSTVVPADGTVVIGDEEAVNFANLRNRGSLIVTKAIVDNSGGSGPYDFLFHVSCNGESLSDFHLGTGQEQSLTHQIDGIPTTQVCTVTEDHDATWATTVDPGSGQATISAIPATVAFTNTKLYTAMTLTKASDPVTGTAVTDGDTITYTLSYANAGNITADVTITDEIPAGTTYVAGSAGDGTLADGTLTWARSVASEGSGSVSFSVTVNDGLTDPFTIDNVAVLHEGETSTPTNETHHPVAHVTIVKAVDQAEAEYGDTLTYTLHVTNPSAANLTDVVVTDAVPAGTTFVSASDGGTCDDPCTTVTWPARDMASGDTFDVTFKVTIDTPAAAADGSIPSSVILNTGEVDANETPKKPSNEVKTIVTAVQGKKIVKPPTLPQTGSSVPIPQAVVLALGLLLAGAGLTFGTGWRSCLARAAEER